MKLCDRRIPTCPHCGMAKLETEDIIDSWERIEKDGSTRMIEQTIGVCPNCNHTFDYLQVFTHDTLSMSVWKTLPKMGKTKTMNETLNNVFAKCQQLPDEDFGVLLSALMREQKERDCKKQKAAWARVREAITHYTANYGNIRVADFCGDEDTEIILHHGEFAFSEYGDIEVGA